MSSPSPTRPIVVVLPVSPWSAPKRLRKQFAEVLALDTDVIYVTLPFGLRKPESNTDQMDGRVQILTLAGPPVPLRLLARLPALQAVYERMHAWRMQRRLRRIGHVSAIFRFTPTRLSLIDGTAPILADVAS